MAQITQMDGNRESAGVVAMKRAMLVASRMRKILLRSAFVILSFLFSAPSGACLNDYVTNEKVGAQSRDIARQLTEVSLVEPWDVRAKRLQKEMEQGGDYEVQNDFANALIHTGEAEKAIPVLQAIEKSHPGLYRTASNLGTAYELAGDPVQALEWIRKGIERDPASHNGSEWIHVRILEGKVAHAKEPEWQPEGSILGLDFGNGPALTLFSDLPKGNAGKPLTLEEVEEGLRYQLHERLQFVTPPNALVASLLVDFGDVVGANHHNIGVAVELYQMAKGYDGVKTGKLRDTISARWELAWNANRQRKFFPTTWQDWVLWAGIGGAVLAWVISALRRRRRERARWGMA